MKKLFKLLLMAIVVALLASCGTSTPTETDPAETTPTETTPAETETDPGEETPTIGEDDMYLITDLGTIDDKSFNQGSYEGLNRYAQEVGLSAAKYLRPQGEGDQVYKAAIDQAVQAGAKVIVTPGFLFQAAVYEAQTQYPDVKFIAVDFEPANADFDVNVADNTVSLLYREEQSGFLAGYAAVKDGFTKLGFMGGMAVPAVINFGYGYLSGAEYAAKELGVDVEVKYHYTGVFEAKPEIQTLAASWYNDGTEIIFSCGGGIWSSVDSAAKQAEGKYLIGVDSDQMGDSELIVTSAMKALQQSVYDAAKAAFEDDWKGGETLRYGADQNGVSLSPDFSRFNEFTEADYDAIFDKLATDADGILDTIYTIEDSVAGEGLTVKQEMAELTFEKVTVEIFE